MKLDDPEVERAAYSNWAALKTWFAVNRTKIGKLLLLTIGIAKVTLHFENDAHVYDSLIQVVDLLLIGSGITYAAGGFKSDQYWQNRVEESQPPTRRY